MCNFIEIETMRLYPPLWVPHSLLLIHNSLNVIAGQQTCGTYWLQSDSAGYLISTSDNSGNQTKQWCFLPLCLDRNLFMSQLTWHKLLFSLEHNSSSHQMQGCVQRFCDASSNWSMGSQWCVFVTVPSVYNLTGEL
jgi:hypothetical protein